MRAMEVDEVKRKNSVFVALPFVSSRLQCLCQSFSLSIRFYSFASLMLWNVLPALDR